MTRKEIEDKVIDELDNMTVVKVNLDSDLVEDLDLDLLDRLQLIRQFEGSSYPFVREDAIAACETVRDVVNVIEEDLKAEKAA